MKMHGNKVMDGSYLRRKGLAELRGVHFTTKARLQPSLSFCRSWIPVVSDIVSDIT